MICLLYVYLAIKVLSSIGTDHFSKHSYPFVRCTHPLHPLQPANSFMGACFYQFGFKPCGLVNTVTNINQNISFIQCQVFKYVYIFVSNHHHKLPALLLLCKSHHIIYIYIYIYIYLIVVRI